MTRLKYQLLFFWLQFKSSIFFVPRALLVIVLFSLLLFTLSIAGTKLLYPEADNHTIPIALVLPKEDQLASFAFSFLESSPSVKTTCEFIRTDEQTAKEMLKNKQVIGIILIPESFIQHILNGTNTPATVLLPDDNSVESIIFRTLADSGASILSTAQAGIYAADDILYSYELWDSVSQMETELDQIYLSYAFNRSIYFNQKTITATGTLTVTQFYSASLILLAILFSGIAVIDYLKKDSLNHYYVYRRIGIGATWTAFCKYSSLAISYLISTIFLIVLLKPFPVVYSRLPSLSLYTIFSLFLFYYSIACFWGIITKLCKHTTSSILFLSFVIMLCIFLSGGILPSVFLPNSFQKIAAYLPTTIWLKHLGFLLSTPLYSFTYPSHIDIVKQELIFTALLFLLSVIAEQWYYKIVQKQ